MLKDSKDEIGDKDMKDEPNDLSLGVFSLTFVLIKEIFHNPYSAKQKKQDKEDRKRADSNKTERLARNNEFLQNKAWGFHILMMIVRLITTAIRQTHWQEAFRDIEVLEGNPVAEHYTRRYNYD